MAFFGSGLNAAFGAAFLGLVMGGTVVAKLWLGLLVTVSAAVVSFFPLDFGLTEGPKLYGKVGKEFQEE